jgi:hypothetical protein
MTGIVIDASVTLVLNSLLLGESVYRRGYRLI